MRFQMIFQFLRCRNGLAARHSESRRVLAQLTCATLLGPLLLALATSVHAELSLPEGCASYDAYAPAREAIADLQRIVAPGGVQEHYALEVGGIEQWLNVRGQSRDNPLLLFVHGGPAAPVTPAVWQFQRPFEEFFTVVQWDQRGAGRTFARSDHEGLGDTLRVAQYVDDLIEVTEHLLKRFDQQRLVLVAHSWGSVPALAAAARRPDLFDAYVGIGQVINFRENERLSYAYALEQARKHDNEDAVEELLALAPYPGDEPLTRQRLIDARRWAQYYGGMSAYRNSSPYYFLAPRLSPDYEDADRCAIDRGSQFTLEHLLPELLEVNFAEVQRLDIPVVMVLGRHDWTTPTAPTEHWLDELEAPYKHAAWFEHSSHMAPWEEPGRLLLTLLEHARPFATGERTVTE